MVIMTRKTNKIGLVVTKKDVGGGTTIGVLGNKNKKIDYLTLN